jgi:hypothetical protein
MEVANLHLYFSVNNVNNTFENKLGAKELKVVV